MNKHAAQRSHADVRDLRPGHWLRSPQHVWYRCTECGATVEIPPHDYGISRDGTVMPAFVCPTETCVAALNPIALRLDGWSLGDAFDTSDVRQP